MSKPKTALPKKGRRQEKQRQPQQEAAPAKPERCKWDPSFCAKVEALGAAGKSAPEIRKELGISPSTWRNWTKTHPC
jgi:hypothetical protein